MTEPGNRGPAGGRSSRRECHSLARGHPGGSWGGISPNGGRRPVCRCPRKPRRLCAAGIPHAGARLSLRRGEGERKRARRKEGRREGKKKGRGGKREGREGREGVHMRVLRQEHLPNRALRKAAVKTLATARTLNGGGRSCTHLPTPAWSPKEARLQAQVPGSWSPRRPSAGRPPSSTHLPCHWRARRGRGPPGRLQTKAEMKWPFLHSGFFRL